MRNLLKHTGGMIQWEATSLIDGKVEKETGAYLVHSHFNGELARTENGRIAIARDEFFLDRKPAYGAYGEALTGACYNGFMNGEFCHPARYKGKRRAGS
jgi:hypothetical protein